MEVVVLSHRQAADVERTLKLWRAVQIVPNAVTAPDHPPVTRLPGDTLRLVFVGEVTQQKGSDDLLAALPVGAELTVVGRGAERYEDHVLSSGARVNFLGHRCDARPVIASNDVLVLPSYVEAMPMVVLEAFAAAVPVVTTDVGALPRDGDERRRNHRPSGRPRRA